MTLRRIRGSKDRTQFVVAFAVLALPGIAPDLDGSTTAIASGDDDLMRVFGQDAAYLSGGGLFSLLDGAGLPSTCWSQLAT